MKEEKEKDWYAIELRKALITLGLIGGIFIISRFLDISITFK